MLERVAASPAGARPQRVSGLPEFPGSCRLPALADEILTPGEGQVRAMLVYAGNPVLSTPGGARLDEALAALEWCVAVDMYVTETSRHADVILPPVSSSSARTSTSSSPPSRCATTSATTPRRCRPRGRRDRLGDPDGAGQPVGRGRGGARATARSACSAPRSRPSASPAWRRVGPYGGLRSRPRVTVRKVRRQPTASTSVRSSRSSTAARTGTSASGSRRRCWSRRRHASTSSPPRATPPARRLRPDPDRPPLSCARTTPGCTTARA